MYKLDNNTLYHPNSNQLMKISSIIRSTKPFEAKKSRRPTAGNAGDREMIDRVSSLLMSGQENHGWYLPETIYIAAQ